MTLTDRTTRFVRYNVKQPTFLTFLLSRCTVRTITSAMTVNYRLYSIAGDDVRVQLTFGRRSTFTFNPPMLWVYFYSAMTYN